MMLDEWAAAWGISAEAVRDLRGRILRNDLANVPSGPAAQYRTESPAQDDVRVEASEQGARLWRNNVGACVTETGSHVRYGLANDSTRVNRRIKSSDLIGIRPVEILPEHVGRTLGQFVAREMKRPGWQYAGTEREIAQLRFLELVNGMGGDACFATGRGTL